MLQLRSFTCPGGTPLDQRRTPDTPPAATATLRRALGRWDLAAIGINQTIGGAVFLMPSQIAAAVGAWSPFAILGGTLVTMIVAVSLAEVGSRFEATGGPYLYARTAFGRFVAFEVGWMQWFTRVTSHASVANGLALAVGYYWAGAAQGMGRVALITGVTAVLMWVNVVGIRQGSRMLFALAEQGDLPRVLARIHPGCRTPVNAILFTAGVAALVAGALLFLASPRGR